MSFSIEKKVTEISAESQIRQFAKVTDQYSKKLASLLEGEQHRQSHPNNHHPQNIIIGTSLCNNQENLNVFELVSSDSNLLDKHVLVFYYLCSEMDELQVKAAENYQKMIMLEEEDLEAVEGLQNEAFINSFKFFLETLRMIQRVIETVKSAVQQIFLALQENPKYCFINIQIIVRKSVALMKSVLIFDIFLSESKSKVLWHLYKERIINYYHIVQSPDHKDYSSGVGILIEELDLLYSENLFKMFQEDLRIVKSQAGSNEIALFSVHVLQMLKSSLKEIQRFKTEDVSDFGETRMIIDSTILAVFYHTFFGNLDSAVFKQVLSVNNKFCCVSITAHNLWTPEQFLGKHAGALLKAHPNLEANLQNQRRTVLSNYLSSLTKNIHQTSFQVIMTIMHLHRNHTKTGLFSSIDELKSAPRILINFLRLTGNLINIIKSVTNLHLFLKINMTKSCLYNLCKVVELITTMQWTYLQYKRFMIHIVQCARPLYQFKLLTCIDLAKRKCAKEHYNEQTLDVICSLNLMEKCLNGPLTEKRLLVLALVMNDNVRTCLAPHLVNDLSLEEIMSILQLFVAAEAEINRLCDTSFLFWHKSILKVYLKCYMDQYEDPGRLRYFLSKVKSEAVQKATKRPLNEFQTILVEDFIHKLCGEIETGLRLDFHKKLHLSAPNVNDLTLKDCHSVIQMPTVDFQGENLNIGAKIEKYLSNQFYNLITVSLHDWRTYGEIRKLAEHKYGLVTVQDNLPLGTLEQSGCNVLSIMRNLQEFVLSYSYNINNQIFIEKTSQNKHLNTISITHVAKSLQMNGTGIINTTVNYTYQFLKKKIYMLSQFLYDEQVKSRLMKDYKYFKGRLQNEGEFYTFKYADHFNKTFRKQQFVKTGDDNFLDGLRCLIIEIGNALGFVRMMRSGRVHMGSNAMACFPVTRPDSDFISACRENNLSSGTLNAAENVDAAIASLTSNFSECADYMLILVNAFKKYVQNDKCIHLRNFYLIIPALTLNFVEYSIIMKDNITKKSTTDVGVQFTEDGFTMGLSYVLTVLSQINDFNSLHWFDAVRNHYNEERDKIASQQSTGSSEHGDKLQQTLSLSERRINTFQQEFNLLFYNLSSSKIFFQ